MKSSDHLYPGWFGPSPSTTTVCRAFKISAAAVLLSAFAGQAFAQTSTRFVPFQDFIESVRSAPANTFTNRAEAKVKDPAAIEEMRQAIVDRYKGVAVSHSFLLDNQHYDCVPIDQQPAFRLYGLKSVALAPPAELLQRQRTGETTASRAKSIEEDHPIDTFGNSTRCEAHTIPLLRTTLETMSNFGSLKQYYAKMPDGATPAILARQGLTSAITPAVTQPLHKYATVIDDVNNWGGNADINIWSPYVDRSKSEVFSLSQEWYAGGTGLNTQTVEVGWIVYPSLFGGSEQSHFFIFSTPDAYRSGCYNNSCGDFVQVAESGILGSPFSFTSNFGGTQYVVSAEYKFYQGNWWLGKDGTWIGYYPGSKYRGGQLDQYAQSIQYGVETTGTNTWAPAGSGEPGNVNFYAFSYSAYQNNLYYIDLNGNHVWPNFASYQPSPCYSIGGPFFNGTGVWTRYFYVGGPGGTNC